MTSRIVTIALSLTLTALSTAVGAVDKNLDDSSFRRAAGVGPSVQLYFRAADGSGLTENAFLDRVNHGEHYWWSAPYNGKIVLTLGDGLTLVAPPKNRASKLLPGDPIPPFHAVTLDGQPISNATFKNKITLIDFFAVYCGSCIEEMPTLNAFRAAHPDIQTIAVTFDPAPNVRDLVQTQHFTWPVAADAIPLVTQAGFWFTPTFALVDQNGRVIIMGLPSMMHPKGQKLSEDELAQWVKKHVTVPSLMQ